MLLSWRVKESDIEHDSLKCLHHVEWLNVKFSILNYSIEIVDPVKIAKMIPFFQEIHSFASIETSCKVFAHCRG